MVAEVLLLTLIIELIISLLLYKDIFCVSTILSFVFSISSFCLLINIDEFGVNLCWETYFYISGGVFITIVIEFIVRLFFYKYKIKRSIVIKENKLNLINFYLVFYLAIIILFIYSFFFIRAVSNLKFSSWQELMSYYRAAQTYGMGEIIKIPSVVSNLTKINIAFVYVCMFCFIRDFVIKNYKKEVKIRKKYLLSLITFFPICIMTGARAELIYLICFCFVIYNLYSFYINGKRFNFKSIIMYILLIFVAFLLFTSLSRIVGRNSNTNLFIYLGGSINLFDLFLKNPPAPSTIVGKETFYSINKFLNQIGLLNESYSIHLEFRYYNGQSLGNVYTAFRHYIYDFGLIGCISLHVIFSFFYSIYYEICKRIINRNNRTQLTILYYGVISFGMFLYFYNDYLFASIISINYLLIFIIIALIFYFITNDKVKIKWR